MADLLFSDKPAIELNEAVQDKLADHLFLFLEYHPDYFKSCTAEGSYFRGVENLYSIFKDCAWLINEFSFCYTGEKDYSNEKVKQFSKIVDTKMLNYIYQIVLALRTLQSHTSSAGNPAVTLKCEDWFSKILNGKLKPGGVDDYMELTKTLHGYAVSIKEECGNFIAESARSADRDGIIKRWEDIIVSRYLKKQDLLMDSVYEYINSASIIKETDPYKRNKIINKVSKDMLISYFYYDIKLMYDYADNCTDPELKELLEKSADELSKQRLSAMQNEGILLGSFYDIPNGRISSEQKKQLIDHFFKNELKQLIEPYKSTYLNIGDLTVEIIENTSTVIPGCQNSFKRFAQNGLLTYT